MVAIPPARDYLSALPIELLTQTFSHLPAAETVRTKILNRHFHSVLTSPTLDALLFEPRATTALQNITATVQPLLQIEPNDGQLPKTFAQHLALFLAHRGIQANVRIRMRDICTFVAQWQASHYPAPQPASSHQVQTMLTPPNAGALNCFAQILTSMHVHFHTGCFCETLLRGADDVVRAPFSDLPGMAQALLSGMRWLAELAYSPTPAGLAGVLAEIRDSGLRSGDVVPRWEFLPDFPLTKVRYVMRHAAHDGVPRMEEAKRSEGGWLGFARWRA
ncbi:hypothetical protein LTR91_010116 [Friedmanniomyces endolithicus]|uniref:F-box domain-containing protein n=1 Tax=Friedmanniomyces endolithicus TaxID=329885 RepID=A0AAN6KJQ9_9PEZI|nr:hypothetical protein LTR38_012109 [Friedmanniomyces endolithicus]KAK0790114.1 hypothetical protein LTR75_012135 [Friedmanniomyces endolithicus]KAK0854401.1 hypothetical protein LTR03_002432 [Friedmanniomyces endolithicus]KAK0866150.1 hypothetical protein LTS02_004882 [Friedmanniomyces endolithicus]KAK0878066.1 hypothetical protein LTR87_008122 [Friedmanniomyces endolithicus]